MAFNESEVVRDQGGRFGEKHGAPAEVSLSRAYPTGFPENGKNEDKLEWAYVNGATLTVETDGGTKELGGPRLKAQWDAWEPGDRFEIVGAALPKPALTDAQGVASDLTERLTSGDRSLGLSDISALRSTLNEAEYRAVADDADQFLSEVYPDARAMVVSFDGFSGEPYILGVETSEPQPGSGRNYGDIRPADDGFYELNSFNAEYGHYLQRFENEGLFDEYGTVLTDDANGWGEFVDHSAPNQNNLGLQDSARVYRLSGRH